MLVEIYLIFQIIVFILFFVAYFTKQEVIWGMVVVLAAVLMFTSYTVESYTYDYNVTTGAYDPIKVVNYYPYLSGINVLLFSLALIFMLFDIFEKYGLKMKGG